ncbi:MAG: CPBP family intramembrane glutamic endopeptidase [Bacteroidales bacterium]
MNDGLRIFWNRFFKPDWKFGLFLLLIICIPRFLLVLQANETGNYGYIGIIMFISATVPFIFMNSHGRKEIGIVKTNNLKALVYALLAGLVLSYLLYLIGNYLYAGTYKNWYEYIGKSYNIPAEITGQEKKIMFAIMAITGMTFSPVGEEFFFRGIVHHSFANSIGDKKASIIDSLAFSFTHISHFGLVFINNTWDFYLIPALIWVISMFFVSIIFFQMKRITGSIWGAVLCHSGFNLGMIYCIFYLI